MFSAKFDGSAGFKTDVASLDVKKIDLSVTRTNAEESEVTFSTTAHVSVPAVGVVNHPAEVKYLSKQGEGWGLALGFAADMGEDEVKVPVKVNMLLAKAPESTAVFVGEVSFPQGVYLTPI